MQVPNLGKSDWAFCLLGLLMTSHLVFLGFGAKHCADLANRGETTEQCQKATDVFQEAAETYVAIILALMAPSPGMFNGKPPTTRR